MSDEIPGPLTMFIGCGILLVLGGLFLIGASIYLCLALLYYLLVYTVSYIRAAISAFINELIGNISAHSNELLIILASLLLIGLCVSFLSKYYSHISDKRH